MFPPFISSFLLSSLSYSCFLFSITVSSLLLSFLSSFCFLSSYVCPRYPYLFSSHSLFLLYSPWTISWFLFLCYSILFVLTFLSSLSVVCVCVFMVHWKAHRDSIHYNHTHTVTVSSPLYLCCFDAGNQTGAHWLSSAMRGLILHYSQYGMNACSCVWEKSSGQSAAACTQKPSEEQTQAYRENTNAYVKTWAVLTYLHTHSFPLTKM